MPAKKDPTVGWTQAECDTWIRWIEETFNVAVTVSVNVPTSRNAGHWIALMSAWPLGADAGEINQPVAQVETPVSSYLVERFWHIIARLSGMMITELDQLYQAKWTPVK